MDRIRSDDLDLRHCATEDMLADYFTKPLQGATFQFSPVNYNIEIVKVSCNSSYNKAGCSLSGGDAADGPLCVIACLLSCRFVSTPPSLSRKQISVGSSKINEFTQIDSWLKISHVKLRRYHVPCMQSA